MNSEKTPAISVIMSVYNSEQYLQESVDSILDQTFGDFEFIITDDCSSDGSFEIIKFYAKKDKRIKYFRNSENIGLTKSLNLMLDIAKGKYIARMDSDDISMPERFSKQFDFMENNLEIGVLGTNIRFFGDKKDLTDFPLKDKEIRAALLFTDVVMHPTVLMRKSVLDEHNLIYDETFRISQDYDLWSRMITYTKFANLPYTLLKYRFVDTNISNSTKIEYKNDLLKKIFKFQLDRLGIIHNDTDLILHLSIRNNNYSNDFTQVEKNEIWLRKILDADRCKEIYNKTALKKTVGEYWFKICTNSTHLGLRVLKKYYNSDLNALYAARFKYQLRFIFKCLIKYKRGNE